MDYFGYHLADTFGELTPEQALFIHMGRGELEQKINGVDEKHKGKIRQLRNKY